jgi:hypothetical protein
MRRALVVSIITLMVSLTSFSQATGRPVGTPDPSRIGVDSAQQHLQDITVTKFEDAGFWFSAMAQDEGFVTLRRLRGIPAEKATLDAARLADETDLGIPAGQNVLGARVDFHKRGLHTFSVFPNKPLAIEGICKTLSIWVVGRNFNHVLKILIADFFDRPLELTVGKLNFSGWKKLTVAVPPSVTQTDFHFTTRNGIKFIGLKVDFDMEETLGKFYIYFDDLSAVTDLFLESNFDPDDMQDIW